MRFGQRALPIAQSIDTAAAKKSHNKAAWSSLDQEEHRAAGDLEPVVGYFDGDFFIGR